jgi:hypothetical protein
MKHSKWWVRAGLLLLVASLPFAACTPHAPPKADRTKPATVVAIAGTDLSRVILTKDAAKRLGIETSTVHDEQVHGASRKVVPYSALLYDVDGTSWVYTSTASLTFVRARVTVDFIAGNTVVLTDGPPSGTVIVTVGAPELFGAELGVGDEA